MVLFAKLSVLRNSPTLSDGSIHDKNLEDHHLQSFLNGNNKNVVERPSIPRPSDSRRKVTHTVLYNASARGALLSVHEVLQNRRLLFPLNQKTMRHLKTTNFDTGHKQEKEEGDSAFCNQ